MASKRYVGLTTDEFSLGSGGQKRVTVRNGQEFDADQFTKTNQKDGVQTLLDNGAIREADDDDFKPKDKSEYTYKDVVALIPPTSLEQPHAGAENVTPPDLSGDKRNRDVIPPKTGEKTEGGETVGTGAA